MTSLAGRRIVVTRGESREGPLSRTLRAAGAVPLLSATVEVAPLHGPETLRRLLPPLHTFDWLVVTSPRTVGLLDEVGFFAGLRPEGIRVAAAGYRTAARLAQVGWPADRVPVDAGAEPLLASLTTGPDGQPTPPGRVFFPASAQAGELLPNGLEEAGFDVLRVDLYAPRPRAQDPLWWSEQARSGIDALTFTSPSAVDGLTQGLENVSLLATLRKLPAAVQGPTTGGAALAAGWTDIVEARPRSFAGLVQALEAWFPTPTDPISTTDPLRA